MYLIWHDFASFKLSNKKRTMLGCWRGGCRWCLLRSCFKWVICMYFSNLTFYTHARHGLRGHHRQLFCQHPSVVFFYYTTINVSKCNKYWMNFMLIWYYQNPHGLNPSLLLVAYKFQGYSFLIHFFRNIFS